MCWGICPCLPRVCLGTEANTQHMILLRTVPAFKMWYNCGNWHKFCGFLVVRLITVSCVGYLPLFPGRHETNRGKYPNIWYCYESDCQKPTKFMAVTTVVPHLRRRHMLVIPISLFKEEKRSKPGYYQSLCSSACSTITVNTNRGGKLGEAWEGAC